MAQIQVRVNRTPAASCFLNFLFAALLPIQWCPAQEPIETRIMTAAKAEFGNELVFDRVSPLPDENEPAIGSIVGFDQFDQMHVLAILPGEFAEILTSPVDEFSESTEVSMPPDSPVLADLIDFGEPLEQNLHVTASFRSVEKQAIDPAADRKIVDWIKGQAEIVRAAQNKAQIYLVRSAFRAVIDMQIESEESFFDFVSAKSKAVVLDRPKPWEGRLTLVTPDRVTIGAKYDLLEIAFNPDRTVNNININAANFVGTPKTNWQMANVMESRREEELRKVGVFYATSRKVATELNIEENKNEFLTKFSIVWRLIWTWLGIVVQLIVLATSFAIGKLFFQAKTGTALIGSVALILFLDCVAAAVGGAIFVPSQNQTGFSTERGEMSYGRCEVSIPLNHAEGAVEQPYKLLIFQLEPTDPEKHFTILGTPQAFGHDEFVAALNSHMEIGKEDSLFVFVHGYRNTFDDAVKRAAQLWYDLHWGGAPIVFSWPSKGTVGGYTADENSAIWTQEYFEKFLVDLATSTRAKKIHVIAHSMGNRIVSTSLANLARAKTFGDNSWPIDKVILAAPDVDIDVFRKNEGPKYFAFPRRVTLYASSNDQALKFSHDVHDYRRAGDATGGILTCPPLESIDASRLDTSFENHSYFAAHRSVISDIRTLLTSEKSPGERGLVECNGDGGKAWTFPAEKKNR